MRIDARIVCSAVLAVLAACGHGGPFATPPTETDQPLQPGTPTRLTYNPGADQDAAWLPDESAIVYSADRADHGNDRCLALLPPNGGRVTRTFCNDATLAADSVKTYDGAAVSTTGRVAFVRQSRPPTQIGPRYNELAIGTLASIPDAPAYQSIPFTVSGKLYTGIAQLRWLGDGALVYRAGFAGTVCVDNSVPCTTAFVTSGLDLFYHVLMEGPPPMPLPGTVNASSVSLPPDGDAVYYTLLGDSRVFRLVLSTGAATVYYDFGGGAVVRDLQIAGSRMLAVVGGNVRTLNAPGVGPVQYDLGGTIVMVDVASGAVTTVSNPTRRYQRLALSPSGRRLVAESGGDLWLFGLP